MIPAFLDPLRWELRKDDVGRNGRAVWELLSPLRYVSALIYQGRPVGLVEVPTGFSTDGASVPRLPGAWLIAGGVANRPAVVHDWLYATQRFPRYICDRVFAEAMACEGVGFWRRGLMWAAVRGFGWRAWP